MKRMVVLLVLTTVAAPGWSWWGDGHAILTRAAVRAVPESMPAFFRNGEILPAHCVYDADLFKNRAAPQLHDAEAPEHYYDQELVEGQALPGTRYEFIERCAREGIAVGKVGLLPYAVAEWTQRLAVAFAEYRKWPENRTIQDKCLVYAGFTAHYAEDLCQPLHVTVHFDGRAKADGSSPHSGIHEKVDALVERMKFLPSELARGQQIAAFDELMPAIVQEIGKSRALIDQVYRLEEDLEDASAPEVQDFARERARAATRFTAALFLTAWEASATVKLPDWHKRE